MVVKSYAKINLSLTVCKKLNNGLHNIQSLFCLINLFDEISIKKQKKALKKDSVYFNGNFVRILNLQIIQLKSITYT